MTRDLAMRSLLIPAVVSWFAASSATAQSQLRGRVVSDSGRPIANASVTVTSVGYTVRTDSSGTFALSGTPGSALALVVRAAGYRDDSATVVLARGRLVTKEFTLVSLSADIPEANPSSRVLRGRVTDSEGGSLGYVNVMVNGGNRIIANDSGYFTIPVGTTGPITLLLRRIGFEPEEVKLPSMPDTAIRISLKAVALRLPEQRVTTGAAFVSLDLSGFYRRMAEREKGINTGHFVTPEELEFRKPIALTAAVEQFPQIRIRPIPNSGFPLMRKMRIEDWKGCPLTVYLDRIKIQPTRFRGEPVDEEVNTLIHPTTMAGIEVYPRAAAAPPEFQMEAGTCGIVLVWTK